MKKVLIINTHEIYPNFSEGKLSGSFVEVAEQFFTENGFEIQKTTMQDEYDVEAEIAKHQWADLVLLQIPVNWMGVSWSFKRYMDYVYSGAMGGQLCAGDGRTRSDASKQYGSGGTAQGTKYMMSLTLNAPQEAFNDSEQFFFEGKGVDDLMWPMHLNFRFFAMEPLPTFSCHDVFKNPNIEQDLQRYKQHLSTHIPH